VAISTPAGLGPYDTVEVQWHNKPVASFITDQSTVCSGVNVRFTSTVTGGRAPYRYTWRFGDGKTATVTNPVVALDTTGCGTAILTNRLIVEDANGCRDTITANINVIRAPRVEIEDRGNPFSPFKNCRNIDAQSDSSYTLTIGNISPNASCITAYSVNWGDGTVQNNLPASAFPLTHVYRELGAFNLVISATGPNGCVGRRTYQVANQSNPAGGLGTLGATTGLCAPANVPFVISNWQRNSPGTRYILDFGDGRSVTLDHPLNDRQEADTVNHTYTTSSCPNPSFEARLTVINGCDATPYTAGNIQIRIRPQAAIENVVTACAGRPVNFGNATVLGNSGSNCASPTTWRWNFGDPSSGANDSSNLFNPSHTYRTPGVYTVTLVAGNQCGTTTATRQVCVTEVPVAAFTLDNIAGCGPLTVRSTNTSNALSGCSPGTVRWLVNYAAGFCGTTGDWSFTEGTSATSLNPVFQFRNPGTYTLTLELTNSCGTVTTTQTVTVRNPPRVTLNDIPNSCGPVTIRPIATVQNCGTQALAYRWTITGGTPASATTADPGQISFTTPGTKTVTLEVTNECGTTTVTRQFTVTELPQLTIPQDTSFCPGETAGPFTFITSTAGATVNWTANNTAIGLPASSGNNSIPAFTTVNNTTAQIASQVRVNAVAAGCSTTASFTIRVNPRPVSPAVNTPVSYCIGETASPLSATGTNLRWYTTATGGTATTNAPTPATTTAGSTTYYVSQVNPSGCESPRASITVIVNPIPVISSSTSINPVQCNSATGAIILRGLSPSITYDVQYQRNGAPQNASVTTNAAGELTLSGLAVGTYTNVRVRLNGCPSVEAGPFNLTDPNPPAAPQANSNSPVCSGGTIQLNATPVGTGTFTYIWSGPGGFTSSTQNAARPAATTAMSGVYRVSVVQNGCTSPATEVNVVVNPTPPRPVISSNSPICEGSDLTLTATLNFTGPVTYAWTGPGGYTSALQNPIITAASTAASGNYSLVATATTGNCASETVTLTATINRVPAITAGEAIQPQSCNSATGSIRLTGLEAGSNYTVHYQRNNTPQSVTLSAGTGGVLVIPNLPAGNYTNVEVVLNNCVSNQVGPFPITDPNPPAAPVAGSNGPVCEGTTLLLSASDAGAGATYAWTGPNGFTASVQNPSRPGATAGMSGTYTVTATLNGCTSPAASVNVVINPTPAAAAVASNSPVCAGDQLSLTSNTTFPGPVTYQWSGPNGFTSNLLNPVIPNATALASGTYTLILTATTGNCVSQASTINVVVNPLPQITNASFIAPASCNGATGSIRLEGLEPGIEYLVRYHRNNTGETATRTAGADGAIVLTNLRAGTYTDIDVQRNNCRSNAVGPFVLNDPNPPARPVATPVAPLCSGIELQLRASTATAGNIDYRWTGPGGYSATEQNPSRGSATVSMSGRYYVTATLNGCTSDADSVDVVVNPTPAQPTIGSNGPICEGNTLILTSNSDFTGTIVYQWTGPNGFTSGLPNPSIANAQPVASGTYQLTILSAVGSCAASPTSIDVEVARIPAITGASFTPPQFCASATGSIRLEGLETGRTYTIRYRRNNIPQELTATATAGGILVIPNLTAANYTDIEARYLTCGSNRVGPFQLLDPNPPAAPVVRANSPLCAGSTLELFASTTTAGNVVYTWTGPDGFTSNTQNTTRPNIQPNQSGNYTVVATLEGCASRPVSVDVLVNPYPGIPVITTNSPQCIGNTIRIDSRIDYPGAVTYRWTGPNGFSSNDPNLRFPNAQASISGDYRLVVTATQGGCSSEVFTNVSVGPPPTIDLVSGGTYPTGTEIRLTSSVTNGPIRTWEWTPSTNLSCSNCPEPVATIRRDITYFVKVTNIYGCEATDTVSFRTFCESAQVFIPNAFTPDGDGSNDILMVRAKGIASVKHFRVFNRWGEVVFERNNFQPNDPQHAWDGKVRGTVQPPAVYVYTAEVICENGTTYVYKGNVSILK
jgi:gliding motility-associated-like protein